MKRKVIITCAVTGNAPFNRNHPNFPVTPQQIADAVVEAENAGAAIAHMHVRDPETGEGSFEKHLFEDLMERVRKSGTNIVTNLTAGGGAFFLPDPEDESRGLPESDVRNLEGRTAHISSCRPEIASLDITTGNQEEGPLEFVYLNTTRTLRAMAKRFKELGVKPELEAFQAGDVMFGRQLIEEGLVDGPPMFQFVLGVKWGAPGTPETVKYMKDLLPSGAQWTAMGIAQQEFSVAAQSILLGGHIRVGLEDNLYLDKGVFATNGDLVERAVTIVESLGMAVATPDEAREMLGLRSR